MTDEELAARFLPLYEGQNDFPELLDRRPLLAHYTSIQTLEKIMRDGELWLSNPLFMNDLEEMRFGMNEGRRLFAEHVAVDDAAGSPQRAFALRLFYRHYFEEFEAKHAINIYVFCLSEHDAGNNDGLLSMWRAYGGQGNGAAIVFDTSFISQEHKDSPLLFARVR